MKGFSKALLPLAISLTSFSFAQAAPLLATETSNLSYVQQVAATNAWVEINKTTFENNLVAVQARLQGKAQVCAVMKADAYGHGIGLLLPSVIAMKVPCIAIASNEEARLVRAHGFKGRLMRVRTPTLAEVETALPYDVEELVGGLDFARMAGEVATRHGKTLRIHLGLNSAGMSRNGLEMGTEQGKKDSLALVKLEGLELVGIMTHFAVEDRKDVLEGLEAFKQQSQWIIDNAHLDRSKLILHCANSYTIQNVPEAWLDMVRPGSLLYGEPIVNGPEYKRILSFKSTVASVNAYPVGNTVGYDRTFTLKRDSLLANVPVGFSDGYRRAFTNKSYVLINGQRVPTVGKISMNTMMVDVTDVPGGVKPGDQVVLFGKQGAAEITQAELEGFNGALLSDVYTMWGNSNPRILRTE